MDVDVGHLLRQCRAREAGRARAAREPRALPASAPTDGPLRVVVVMPRTDVGGGARILAEHASRLHDRGHAVTVLGHGPAPTWAGLRAEYVRVPHGLDLADALPAADVVVAGYWDQVLALRAASGLRVLHLEQGDKHVFEDLPEPVEADVRRALTAADATITPSRRVQRILEERYGVPSTVVPNALDPAVFHPRAVVPAGAPRTPYLVTVGWDGNAFKGLDVVREVWRRLRERGHDLELVRVSPSAPLEPWGQVVVAPAQPDLAGLLAGAVAFVGASRYEAWGLPAMEAMACGTPVVSTAHQGILEYATPDVDALLAPVDDVDALVAAVERVLQEPDLRDALVDAGARTAAAYAWEHVVDAVERALRQLAPAAAQVPAEWKVSLGAASFVQADAQERLDRLLASTRAREVHVPVLEGFDRGSVLARWESVAKRKRGEGVVRLHAPARLPAPARRASSTQRDVVEGDARRALPSLVADVERRRGAQQLTAALWLALALVRCGEWQTAWQVASSALEQAPDHADFARLAAVAAAGTGRPQEAESLLSLAEAVGTGARHDEWFTTLEL